METGTVNWFDIYNGFGIIINDYTGNNVVVHCDDIVDGNDSLEAGQRVQFKVIPSQDGQRAVQVEAY